jgi:outer membrane receptor for ferrienterochelin and colicins
VLLGTWNLLAAGVEVGHESLDIDRADTTVNRTGEILDTSAAEVNGRTATVVEAFVQDELSPWRQLTVVPGLRYTWHDRFGHQATPKLSILVDPRPEVRIRLAYGQGFRSPTLKNLYYRFDHADLGFPLIIEGNPDLRPETSHGATASVEVRPRRGVLLAAGGAYTTYRNLIERGEVLLVDSAFVSRLENVGTAHTATFDVGADATLGRYLGVMAGYVFLWSRAEDTGKALINRPAHQVKAEVRFRHARWGLSATVAFTWQSEVFVNAANTRTSPGYPVLGAWIEQRLYRGLHAYLRGLNLTNSRRSGADPLDLRPQPGWQLLGGLRYRLAER